jgi:hypothetical protein
VVQNVNDVPHAIADANATGNAQAALQEERRESASVAAANTAENRFTR